MAKKRPTKKHPTGITQKDLKEHRVTFLKDTILEYPPMWLDVFVAGSVYEERQFAEMFVRASCSQAATPEDADIVIFTGGPDVDPALYGAKPHSTTRTDKKRDEADVALFNLCQEEGIPMLGICRGAQFLSVMNGGSLYQDVDNHCGDHDIWDIKNKEMVRGISSVHHQMVMPHKDMEVIAFAANRSTKRHLTPSLTETGPNRDIEAFFYRETCSLGIQGHPEYSGYHAFTKWSLDIVSQFVMNNPDIVVQNHRYRMNQNLIKQRPSAIN